MFLSLQGFAREDQVGGSCRHRSKEQSKLPPLSSILSSASLPPPSLLPFLCPPSLASPTRWRQQLTWGCAGDPGEEAKARGGAAAQGEVQIAECEESAAAGTGPFHQRAEATRSCCETAGEREGWDWSEGGRRSRRAGGLQEGKEGTGWKKRKEGGERGERGEEGERRCREGMQRRWRAERGGRERGSNRREERRKQEVGLCGGAAANTRRQMGVIEVDRSGRPHVLPQAIQWRLSAALRYAPHPLKIRIDTLRALRDKVNRGNYGETYELAGTCREGGRDAEGRGEVGRAAGRKGSEWGRTGACGGGVYEQGGIFIFIMIIMIIIISSSTTTTTTTTTTR
eukprot:766957-Hanusia_phi.AAC.10